MNMKRAVLFGVLTFCWLMSPISAAERPVPDPGMNPLQDMKPWVTWMQISLDKYTVRAGEKIGIFLMIITRNEGADQNVTFTFSIAGPPGGRTIAQPSFTRKFAPGTQLADRGSMSVDTAECDSGLNTVTLTAKDANGIAISASDQFTVTNGAVPPPPPPVKFVPPPPRAVNYEGTELGYGMSLTLVPDPNGNAIVHSGTASFGSKKTVIIGGMSSMGLMGTPGGSDFLIHKCDFMGRSASLEGYFVDENNPGINAIPKVGVDYVVIKLSGSYDDNRDKISNPLTGEPFVVFKLRKRN